MALTKPARSKILALVQDAKRLLMKEVEEQLQQYYGVRPDGTVLMIEQLTTSDSDFIYTARVLRQRLDYIKTNLPDKTNEDVEAVRQLVREQAFTILNRFASLRMAEERGIIKETVRKEYNSEGFQVFDSITGQGQTASQYMRYKWYIHAIFDALALDLPSVFDRYSPYALIFPSEQAMNRLLDIINREEITLHREEGLQPVNLWKEDETIGWIYQYYNSREEISAMRDASDAPRNSQELAVRNQFFTPRYVVQFLTDNSLGRIWYEMTEGNTVLKSICPYLIVRTGEIFLRKGEFKPESKDENTVYIDHRPIKDPREILMLDPACGSMHFGLYCFDLFEHIYIEAWDNYPELLTDLRNSMTRSEFVKQIPELIIRHNIHGVDIDPRALQIAGLSLWLRAQKSFDKQNLNANQRPQITRSNLVLAEPMPGSVETLSQLVQPLDDPMRKLVLAIWDKMKLAGETGLLLRIEDEIDKTINEISQELADGKMSTQLSIGGDDQELMAAEKAALYATKQYRERFLNSAEAEVLNKLKHLAETATDGDAYQKLLFADDTARGFAFIELCRKKYDVVAMNPPFGAASIGAKEYLEKTYLNTKSDLAGMFIERMIELLKSQGLLGSITTRTIFFIGSFTSWRLELLNSIAIESYVDLGTDVLDALVDTSACVLQKNKTNKNSNFIRLIGIDNNSKPEVLKFENIKNIKNIIYSIDTDIFKFITNAPFCYWLDVKTLEIYKTAEKFELGYRGARQGMKTGDNDRFTRNRWEIDISTLGNTLQETNKKTWTPFLLSDESRRFFLSQETVVLFKNDGLELKNFTNPNGQLRSRPADTYGIFYKAGLSWSLRSYSFKPHVVPQGHIAQPGRVLAVFNSEDELYYTLGIWNTKYYDFLIKLSMERADAPLFKNGIVNNLPFLHFEDSKKNEIIILTKKLIELSQFDSFFDECSIYFLSNEVFKIDSIKSYVEKLKNEYDIKKKEYSELLVNLDAILFKYLNIEEDHREAIRNNVNNPGTDRESDILNFKSEKYFDRLFSILVGCCFGNWDVRFLKEWKKEWNETDFLKARKQSPFMFAQNESIFDIAISKYHKEIEQILKVPYPLETLMENASSNAVVSKLKEVIMYFWPDSASTIEFELQDHFGVSNLETIFINSNKFFDSHLKDYTRNKRISPIYWPISTASGSYTIWLYYPKMNDQTLFKVVNDYILPKQQEVAEQIKKLENNPDLDNKGKKELQDNQNLFHELKDMEKDLLEVASLPYKPNHDDGVLITAAPLYKFFRHSKWKISTEECWKALQKGEYDWAHLAYSIWPERVTKKCKKDLSMAIAHGLEEICEVKPKEKKEKKVAKSANKNIQGKLID